MPLLKVFICVTIATGTTAFARGTRPLKAEDLQTIVASTSTPKDGDVCFSPDEQCDAKLIKLIQSAQSSIDIAIYDINLEQLVHQLLVQSKKLQIRVLVDKRQSKEPKSLVALLVKGGISVRYGHQKGIMHNKFVIIDNKMLETGSFNFTNHASVANNENQIYLSNPSIVKRYRDRYDHIWNEGKPISAERGLSSQ